MAISKVSIKNLTVFENITVDLCAGINVIIGENGTGKTTLLRTLYDFSKPTLSVFDKLSDIVISEQFLSFPSIGERKFKGVSVNVDSPVVDCTYIPEKDMLEHSKGLLGLYNDIAMPFVPQQIDIIAKAQRPETRELTPNASKLLEKVELIIGGEVVYENEEFYTKKLTGQKIIYAKEASGFKKFGLLWKLLRNGLLEEGTVLFWDEPENSLNPELVPKLIDILLRLSRNGVQIFLATHDYIFAKYIEVKMSEQDDVLFHAFYNTDSGVKVETQKKFIALENNSIIKQSIQLYKDEVRKVME